MKTVSLICLSLSLVFLSCKKYEDGPALSLTSKKNRVANTWVIQQAFNNGEDVTEEYDEYTLRLTPDGNAELAALYSFGNFNFEYETNGTWSFANSNEELVLNFENDDADAQYQILKLKSDEMWLRELGGEDELHLITK